MISILFEKPLVKTQTENHGLHQGVKGITGMNRWYTSYVDTPDKRIGYYKIVVVLQKSISKTFSKLLHSLIHVFINVIYGEKEVGNKIHDSFDNAWRKIEKRFYIEKPEKRHC